MIGAGKLGMERPGSIAQKVYGGGGLHRVRSFLPPGIRTTTPTPVHGAGKEPGCERPYRTRSGPNLHGQG